MGFNSGFKGLKQTCSGVIEQVMLCTW